MKTITCLITLLAFACIARGQDLTPTAPPQDMPIALVNATIHAVDRPVIENGWVSFTDGVITGVGEGEGVFTAVHRIIDLDGAHVYPGLILSKTGLGLQEISAVRATRDRAEVGVVTPEVRAITAINPDSTLLPVARSNGIAIAAVFPSVPFRDDETAPMGLVPGTASIVRLDGWTNDDLSIEPAAGLVINWPRSRPIQSWWTERDAGEQVERSDRNRQIIDGLFEQASAYRKARQETPDEQPIDLALEAVMPALLKSSDVTSAQYAPTTAGMRAMWRDSRHGQSRVFINANDRDDITAAVSWAIDRGLNPVICGGRDAPEVADMLNSFGVPVIVDGINRFPKRADQPYDAAFTVPAQLEAAGVHWAFTGAEEPGHERSLAFSAGRMVAFGLTPEAALRSMTLSAAEILGIDDRFGSITPGKSATIIIADGDILQVPTRVTRMFIDGRDIDLSNKQTELIELYREKYRQLGLIEDTNEDAPE